MSVIYIAGPITLGDPHHNVNQAKQAALEIIRAGHAPIIPQLHMYLEHDVPSAESSISWEEWLASDKQLLNRADAILRLPGDSKGADLELYWAGSRGIPVFHDVQQLIDYYWQQDREKYDYLYREAERV